MIVGQEKPSPAFVAHFGVKGMRWGVIRTSQLTGSERQKKISKIEKKIDKVDADKAMVGYGLRGGAMQKMFEKRKKKDPNFSYKNLSPAEKKSWNKKASNRVMRKIALMGAVESATIIGGSALLLNNIKVSPQSLTGAKVTTGMITGANGLMRFSEINSVRTANKLDELKSELAELKKEG